MRLPVVACLGLLMLAGRQAQPYRGSTDIVSIYATVRDDAGHLVPDLVKDDFVVKDNGRKQPLAVFGSEAQPLTLMVMIDCSGSMSQHQSVVRDGASEFVTRLAPADRARVGSFAREIRMTPDRFTSDHAVLLDALRTGLQPIGPSPIWTAIDRSITALLHEPGRRVVVIFTDGEDAPERGQVFTDLKDIIWRARVDDVTIYTIAFQADSAGPRWQKPGAGYRWNPPSRSDGDDGSKALRQLAEQTGGGYLAMKGPGDLRAAFTRVAEELHHQYWLGFTPKTLDDEMHQLDVSVRRGHVSVLARKSYFAGTLGK